MKFLILHIGKTTSTGLSTVIKEFEKRSKRYASIEVLAIDGAKGKRSNESEVKRIEADNLLAKIQVSDHVILLDEKGHLSDSRAFAKSIADQMMISGQRIVFVIGGAYGFDIRMQERSDREMSLSPMTFNHELALAVFMEQLYRALTIIKGHPYHND